MPLKISNLQMKGIFTLSLFLLAESATFGQQQAQAKTKENRFRNPFARNNRECSAEDDICASPLVTQSIRLPQKNGVDCLSADCSKCLEACTSLPRGGHYHGHSHSHAAEAAADAVLDAASGTTPFGLPLNLWKVLMQAFLTGLNVLCWYVPLRSKQISDNRLALSLANAFSGGVFLSLAFVHLIPECTHGFGNNWPEAAPFGLVLCGYLLIFFVEKVAFDAHDILHEMQAGGGGHSHSHSHATTPATMAQQKAVSVNGGHALHAHESSGSTSSASSDHSGRSALILLGALGVHSVLEMMALGLSDSFGDSALLTMSIALHQPAESIALLVAFLKSGMPKGQIIQFLSIFSCMGPIGVALGMAVNEYAAPIVDSIMLAIVAGTFVYVGATEVIPEEWEDSSHKWTKFTALMSGIVVIVGITQYTATLGH